MSDPTTRPDHCQNCGNWLSAIEQRGASRMCNACLDLPSPERTIDDHGSKHDVDDMFRHSPNCQCPDCDPDWYADDPDPSGPPSPDPDPDDPNYGSLISGCWCPEGHCTCDAVAEFRAEFD